MIPLIKTSFSQTRPSFLFNGIYLWSFLFMVTMASESTEMKLQA